MPRAARVVVEGVPHHITQRGNNRQDVFLVDEDRRYYLEILRDKCRQHGVTLLGYCLMTNHVHLIGVPRQPTSLALAPGPGPLALRGALPSTLPPQRPFVAKPLLFVSVRAPSLGHRAGLCGPESTAGGAGGGEMREMRDRSAIGPPSGSKDRRESDTSRSASCNVIRITLRLELG
jgi:hypothetical protein